MYINIDDSLNSLVYKTNIILKGKLQSFLNNFNITSDQWVMLNRLYQKNGYNQKELSIDTFKEQAAITRTLDILENKGLAVRTKSTTDRREYLVFITDKGKLLLEDISPYLKQYHKLLNSVLNKEELEVLTSLLIKLCQGIKSDS